MKEVCNFFPIAELGANLLCHNVPQKHDVSGVNAHTVLLHDELDLVDDVASGCLDAKDSSSLDDVVCSRMFADDA